MYKILMLLLLCKCADAQDISGTWVGNYSKGKQDVDIPGISLNISVKDSSIVSGTLTVHFEGNRHQRYAISGIYDSIDATVQLKEDSGISHNVSEYRILRDYNLNVVEHEGKLQMLGFSRSYADGILSSAKLQVWFEQFTAIPELPTENTEPLSQPDGTIDINGKWVGAFGTGNQNSDIANQQLNIRLTGDSIKGTLREYFSNDKYQDFIVSGYLENNVLHLTEDSVSIHNLSGPRALRDYKMKVIDVDGRIRLEGISKSYTMGIITASKLPVWFEREMPTTDTASMPGIMKEEPLKKRPVKTAKTIQIEKGSTVRVELTDNARIDNDIISLYINNKKVFDKQALSHTPVVYNFIVEADVTEIAMYAESCGAMPPCTATMEIITGSITHIIDMTSDYNISGAVKLVLRK